MYIAHTHMHKCRHKQRIAGLDDREAKNTQNHRPIAIILYMSQLSVQWLQSLVSILINYSVY